MSTATTTTKVIIKKYPIVVSFYRKDRLKAREKAAFNINQLIEYNEEQDYLNLNKFFVRWIRMIKENDNDKVTRYIHTSIKSDFSELSEADIRVEADYEGVHLDAPLFNEADFLRLIDSFGQQQILHTRYALTILNRAIDYLTKVGNINEIDCLASDAATPAEGQQSNSNSSSGDGGQTEVLRVNVVGDLHGQFNDLSYILESNEMPSSTNKYLFNGDFVDRGDQQIEVFLTLLYALVFYNEDDADRLDEHGKVKAREPVVYLNRGNHEDYGCSVRYMTSNATVRH